MNNKGFKKQKITLLLDNVTLDALKNYAITKLGSTSYSAAVRAIVRDINNEQREKE